MMMMIINSDRNTEIMKIDFDNENFFCFVSDETSAKR